MRALAFVIGCWMLGVALTYAAAPTATDAPPATHTVLIENMRFSPADLAVRRGDRVVFKNADLMPHTVTSLNAGLFDSGLIESGKSWTLVAENDGRQPYRCTFHPTMTGVLLVEKTR